MNTNTILKDSYLNLLFKNKNKLYGAYELRTNYNKRLYKSFFILMLVCALFVSATKLLKPIKNKTIFIEVTPTNLPQAEPKKEAEKPKEKPKEPVQKRYKQKIFVTPKPSKNDFVKTIILDDSSKISNISDTSSNTDFYANRIIGDTTTTLLTNVLPTKMDTTKPVTIITPPTPIVEIAKVVDVEASFDGDWRNYLIRNLNANIATNNGAAPGRYKINIEFVVDVNGSISDLKPTTDIGYELEKEAMRVIKKSKLWIPAKINGANVKAFKTQTIIFEVLDES